MGESSHLRAALSGDHWTRIHWHTSERLHYEIECGARGSVVVSGDVVEDAPLDARRDGNAGGARIGRGAHSGISRSTIRSTTPFSSAVDHALEFFARLATGL